MYCVFGSSNVPILGCYIHEFPPPVPPPIASSRSLSWPSSAGCPSARPAIFRAMYNNKRWSSSRIRPKCSRSSLRCRTSFFCLTLLSWFIAFLPDGFPVIPGSSALQSKRYTGIPRASEIFSSVSIVGTARPFSSHEIRQRARPVRLSKSAWDKFLDFRSARNRAPTLIRMILNCEPTPNNITAWVRRASHSPMYHTHSV